MPLSLPSDSLTQEQINYLSIFSKSCRRTILEMVAQSQSGHPGGSLSSLDILSTLYALRIRNTNEKVVISNGHISPGVYSVLAELGIIDKKEVISSFRSAGSIFEGHVTREVPGVWFGTGPLGVGVSAASGFAKSQKIRNKGSHHRVFGIFGDGEAQEGQVHEMALFSAKHDLSNLTLFCDYNRVQLSNSLENVLPINLRKLFESYGWHVLEIDGHNYEEIWQAMSTTSDSPILVLAHTIMGKGVPLMEPDGKVYKSTWHGKTPSPEDIKKELALPSLTLDDDELKILKTAIVTPTTIQAPPYEKQGTQDKNIHTGTPREYTTDTLTDCRSAYGNALQDLATNNQNILAASADLSGSVKTDGVEKNTPDQYVEYGICEQNMVSSCGAISLDGWVPFCSTFGAFMSSRAKDQARVNDINRTNVKMVSTHCGLSVGEDGPTHQAIDDMGSFLGLFHTNIIEPADPNHCDRIIRYAASHYGNFYVRMGRHKLPVLTKEDGSLLFPADYQYEYGKCEVLRRGSDVTIIASGPTVTEALQALEKSNLSAEIIIPSSPKKFDTILTESINKTKKVIVVEDHNALSGFSSQVALHMAEHGIFAEKFVTLSVKNYQLSGKPSELYHLAGIDAEKIAATMEELIK